MSHVEAAPGNGGGSFLPDLTDALGSDNLSDNEPSPVHTQANTPRPENDDPLLLPPSGAGRSPAALTNDAESTPKREETPPAEVSRSSEAPAKEPAKEHDRKTRRPHRTSE